MQGRPRGFQRMIKRSKRPTLRFPMPSPTPFVLLLCALSVSCAIAQKPAERTIYPRRSATVRFDGNIEPLLSQYCFGCHGNGKRKGDLTLDQWSNEAAAIADTAIWQRVLKKIQDGEMPPENKPQPSFAERGRLTKWI